MSTQAIADFILKANEDPEFFAKIEGDKAEERFVSLVAAGRKQGYEFTVDECQEFLAAARQFDAGELSEEQLAVVAGGGRSTSDSVKLAIGKVWNKVVQAFSDDSSQQDADANTDNAVAGVRG